MTILIQRAPPPCCNLEGRWTITLKRSAVGSGRPDESGDIHGSIVLSDLYPDHLASLMTGRVADTVAASAIRSIRGRSTIDLDSLLKTSSGLVLSSGVLGPTTSDILNEVGASVFDDDSVTLIVPPRISHLGVYLSGRIVADTINGTWSQRSMFAGLTGEFRMERISRDPGPIAVPASPEPRASEEPSKDSGGEIRVRAFDRAHGRYVTLGYGLNFPDGSIRNGYYTDSLGEGWGKPYRLAPGHYVIEIDDYPCEGHEYRWFLKQGIRHPFNAVAAKTTDITVEFDSHKFEASRTFDNTNGKPCPSWRR